jgi:hypothetical protein
MSLFFSHFSLRKPVHNEKFSAVDHAIDRVARASRAASTVFPLFNHNHSHPFKIRSNYMTISSQENMAASFEDNLHLEICIPGVSRGGEEGLDSLLAEASCFSSEVISGAIDLIQETSVALDASSCRFIAYYTILE